MNDSCFFIFLSILAICITAICITAAFNFSNKNADPLAQQINAIKLSNVNRNQEKELIAKLIEKYNPTNTTPKQAESTK